MDLLAGVINKVMVAAPFLLVTSLGIEARHPAPEFRFTALSKIEDSHYSNYIPIARKVERQDQNGDLIPTSSARELAKEWIEGTNSGLLKPLPPISIDDTSRDGVKSEIVRDANAIAESLNYNAMLEGGNGNYSGAVSDALLASQVLKAPRLFDFSSLAVCAVTIRRSLDLIKDCVPKLSAAERANLKSSLRFSLVSNDEIRRLTLQVKSVLVSDENPLTLSRNNFPKYEKYLSLTKFPTLAELRTHKFERMSFSADDLVGDLLNEYRLGLASALETNAKVQQLQSAC